MFMMIMMIISYGYVDGDDYENYVQIYVDADENYNDVW